MGKHASERVKTSGPYRLSFVDDFTGDEAAEDFGFSYESVAAAREAAERTWKETSEMSEETNASEIKWEGAIGTCSYETSFVGGKPGQVHVFTCYFIVTRHLPETGSGPSRLIDPSLLMREVK